MRVTSLEVYKKITDSGLLSKKRSQVYSIIYNGGIMSGSEVSKEYKKMYSASGYSESIRNRITELVQQGVVEEVSTGECPITKNTVLLFRTTNNLPVKIPKKESKKNRVDNTLEAFRELYRKKASSSDEDWKKVADLIKQI